MTAATKKYSLHKRTTLAVAGLLMAALGVAVAQTPAEVRSAANLRALNAAAAAYATSNDGKAIETAGISSDKATSASAPATHARTMPAGPTVNVAVTEWAVFLADMTTRQMNRREAFDDALPAFVNDARRGSSDSAEARKGPAPMGLIRLSPTGTVNTDVAIDVQVTCKTAKVLGHWPTAKPRASGVLWQDVHFATATEKPRSLPEGTWLGDLRTGMPAGQMLTCGTVTEPFLLYDLEVSYTANLQVAGGENGKYKVATISDSPLLDVTFYKKGTAGKWRTGILASLERKAATTRASETAPATAPTTRNAATMRSVGATTRMAASQPTTTPAVEWMHATSQPATNSEALKDGVDVSLASDELAEDAVLAPWKAKLAEAGVTAGDQQVVLKILAKYALDSRRLTAVYRMDPAELDKMLPLEVVPQPRKVSRIALVIVKDIDPAVGDEVNDLIKQLGNASWVKREEAMTELRKMGVKAKPQLEKALKEKDLEIVYRAEQLLQALAAPEPNEAQN